MHRGRAGFTLIELLIVVAIIGILAMVGIPAYIGQQRNATRTEAYTNLQNLRLLQEQFFSDSGNYTATIGAAGSTTAIRDANLPLIRAVLPRFQPGQAAVLNYSYSVIQNFSMTNPGTVPWDGNTTDTAPNPCFIAVATGVVGTRVAGDIFAIDCNNNRNF
jgi:prepilin-type N-terminal cleavage/methylation domain-containing protein